ncbi:MAG: alcohol dehydrogenase [Anaerolineae bacterium]|nr:MAG: alcohol dehydrogenase [Anaerolineae bacterium]WKZ43636.1 MAG: NAD(P)-dependent alcohol dehydrogenase [Anaerolineales bacterium]
MKAVVHESYGLPTVLKIKEIEKPEVADDAVLVRVRASSVNIAEWYGMTGLFIARIGGGLFKPKDQRIGADFSGVVEAVGKNRTDFKPGDEVFGGRGGSFAEYVSVKNAVARKPTNLTFEEAAAVPTAGITALQGLRDYGKIQPGQKVLIHGASGGVGSFAIQIAKAFGAEVTAVCSTQNVEHARSLGADHVIDYAREDFTRNGQEYDLLFNVNGSRSWSAYKRALKPDAIFVLVGGPRTPLIGPLSMVVKMRLAMLGSSRKFAFFIAKFNREDMQVLKDLIETGKVKPFVERTYPMTRIADAMTHLGAGHAKGKIVVSMG